MAKPFHIFFIPFWILDNLKAQQVNPVNITNYTLLKQYLSQEDLIELLVFQWINLIHTSPTKLRGTNQHHSSLIDLWCYNADQLLKLEIEMINNIANERKESIQYVQSLVEKLTVDYHDSRPEDFNPYEVLDLKGENIGLVINKGYQKVTPKEFYALVQAILRVLYMYEPTVQVVKRPIFRLYVELMMRNRVNG